jgi:hypothetical protein
MASEKSYDLERRLNALINVIGPVAADVAIADITGAGLKTVSATPQPIPGGSIAGGFRYEIDAAGVFSMGATPPTDVTWSVYYGNISTGTDLGDLSVPGAGLYNAASAGWGLHADVVWLSVSSCRLRLALDWHTAAGAGGSARWFTCPLTTGLDTTGGHALTLAFNRTGGTSMTLITSYCHFSRCG